MLIAGKALGLTQEYLEDDEADVGADCEESERTPRLHHLEHLVRPDGEDEGAAPEDAGGYREAFVASDLTEVDPGVGTERGLEEEQEKHKDKNQNGIVC